MIISIVRQLAGPLHFENLPIFGGHIQAVEVEPPQTFALECNFNYKQQTTLHNVDIVTIVGYIANALTIFSNVEGPKKVTSYDGFTLKSWKFLMKSLIALLLLAKTLIVA